jgi:spore coat protein CotH
MKYFLLAFLSIASCVNKSYSQTTLFDATHVYSVYVEIPADSLAVIMTDVLSDHYYQAMFIYDYGTGRDTLQRVGFRLRGNTSRLAQKKSFKISFNEYVSGRQYQGVKKINLNGQHNDPTMVREKLFYDLWNKSGMANRRTSFVKMFINHVYYGLYTNLEEFDKDWLQRVYGEKSGNLYKCTYPADLVYLGTNQQTYKNIQSGSTTGGRAYDLQTNETADNYSDLVDLISTLDNATVADFAAQIAQKIDIDNLLKAYAFDVASGNWDDYLYNKNNYFLYHRASTGKFEFISYDADNTFGVDWVNRDWATRNCLDWYNHSEPRPLATRILSIPVFQAKYQRYLDTISRQITNPSLVFSQIDAMEALINNAAIADTFRTLDFGYTVADFHNGFTQTVPGHTPYGIKPFLTTRYSYTLQQLSTASVPDIADGMMSILLYPNPAEDIIRLNVSALKEECQGFIVNILGRYQKSFNIGKNLTQIEIPVSDLAPGVYTLVVDNNGRLMSKRFVKK